MRKQRSSVPRWWHLAAWEAALLVVTLLFVGFIGILYAGWMH